MWTPYLPAWDRKGLEWGLWNDARRGLEEAQRIYDKMDIESIIKHRRRNEERYETQLRIQGMEEIGLVAFGL